MDNGNISIEFDSLESLSGYQKKRMEQLPAEHKRFINPHEYKVGISKKLMDQRNNVREQIKTENVL